MIHWTYQALRPCAEATLAFFWGEAAWGMTLGLRRLRLLRLVIMLLAFLTIALVSWAIIEHELVLARNGSDSYSYYEGKVLEERLTEAQRKIEGQSADIKRILLDINTVTLLNVKMQNQLDRQQEILDIGIRVFGALVILPTLAFLWSVFKNGLRKERTKLGLKGKQREEDAPHDWD